MVLAVAIIATMTLICVVGTDISSRLQNMGRSWVRRPTSFFT